MYVATASSLPFLSLTCYRFLLFLSFFLLIKDYVLHCGLWDIIALNSVPWPRSLQQGCALCIDHKVRWGIEIDGARKIKSGARRPETRVSGDRHCYAAERWQHKYAVHRVKQQAYLNVWVFEHTQAHSSNPRLGRPLLTYIGRRILAPSGLEPYDMADFGKHQEGRNKAEEG